MWHCRRNIAGHGTFVKQNQELFSHGTKARMCCTGNPSVWHPGSVVLTKMAFCHFEQVPMRCTVNVCMFAVVLMSSFSPALPSLLHIHHIILKRWMCKPVAAVTGCHGNLGHNTCTRPKPNLSRGKKTKFSSYLEESQYFSQAIIICIIPPPPPPPPTIGG